MKIKSVLTTAFLLLLFGVGAQATTIFSPPVLITSGGEASCVVANMGSTDLSVTTKLVAPNVTFVLESASFTLSQQ